MKIVIAMDSFKGSLSSMKAGSAVADGIKRIYSDAQINVCPVADGGEGTVDALSEGLKGVKRIINVTGPLGNKVNAAYFITEDNIAYIEMSSAAGITLVDKEKLNPLDATTFGVGEIIVDAVNNGIRDFVIGIGGSATNDGGIGMLQALGYDITDECGNDVLFGAKGLENLKYISDTRVNPILKECSFAVACDVNNPLCGKDGCSVVYGPQKGATQEMIEKMDRWLLNYSEIARNINENASKDYPGSGAAGGMGFAFLTFLNASLTSGTELVLNKTGLKKYIKNADLVITGEGRIDGQTSKGKTPVGVAKIAKEFNTPVIAFCGSAKEDADECNAHGIDAFFPIIRNVVSLSEAMNEENAYKNMADTVEQVMRLIKTIGKRG